MTELAGYDYISGVLTSVMSLMDEERAEKAKKESENDLLVTYVTDALKVMGNLNVRYYDWKHPKPEFTKTEEEIVDSLQKNLARLGGK